MGRILALDFGLRRVGAAISDAGRRIASPLEIYERRDRAQEARLYRRLVEEEGVERIIVGLPVHLSGREGELARAAREWGRWLAEATGRPVQFVDERFTSVEAENLLIEHKMTSKRRKERRDKLAAQILLQGYLDAGCPEGERPAGPLGDEGRT